MADITPRPPAPAETRLKAYYQLTKPGIAGYVMITAGVTAFVASRGRLGIPLALNTMAATGIATAGALTLNQWVERHYDAKMVRTRFRPVPSGRVSATEALLFGLALLAAGVVYLALAVGWKPAALAAASAAAYHMIYTPLKTRGHIATLAGGIPGAMPVLIGWTAATGSIDAGGWGLFAIAYAWQLPHVLGLAWMLRADYARVGFKLIPPHDAAGKVIGWHMMGWLVALVPLSGAPTWLGYTGWIYFVGALAASLVFLSVGVGAARDLTDVSARKVFLGSLLYHPVLLVLMLIDTARL